MRTVKAIIAGPPGTGKTSLLAHLLNAGYTVHIADFDGNTLPLHAYTNADALARLHVTTLQDKLNLDAQTMMPSHPTPPRAYPAFVKMIQKEWDGRKLREYGLRHVFVIDSLTTFSEAVFRYSQWQAGFDGKRPHPSVYQSYGLRMTAHMQQFAMAPVNFLILAHLMRMTPGMDLEQKEDENSNLPKHGDLYQRYPYVAGRALPPRLAGYFPVFLHAKRLGEGPAARRVVGTSAVADLEVKCPLGPGSKYKGDVAAAQFAGLFAELGGYAAAEIDNLSDSAPAQEVK